MARAQSAVCHEWLEQISDRPHHPRATATRPSSSTVVEKEPLDFFTTDPWNVAVLSDAEKMQAIECLLGAESNQRPAGISGAMRFDISQLFDPAKVNLAALYAISYIYTGRYDHAGAVALTGSDASSSDRGGFYVTKPQAIHRAYKAHRVWFEKVRVMGFTRAKMAGLDPLEGTGLEWYSPHISPEEWWPKPPQWMKWQPGPPPWVKR